MALNVKVNTSPQILSGTVALAAGMTQTVSMDAMASRSHRWLRLDELSISYWASPDATVVGKLSSQKLIGSFVNLRARAYRQDLMMNYVPTWLLGPRLHVEAEYENFSTAQIPTYGPFETYRWKFPKPFYLPPGSAFILQLQRNGSATDLDVAGTINAQVVVRGAQLNENDARAAMNKGRSDRQSGGNPIPYIASYTPLTFPNKSNNLDLANPFLVPLQLQRMTARIAPDFGSASPATGPAYGVAFGNTVRLTDTRKIICEYSDLLQIFPASQLAWTHTRVLQPGEYVTAELTQGTAGFNSQVAIIGYRNEVLS